jgi:large subunit ribosomal protein L6
MRGRAAYPFYSLFADPDEVAVVARSSHEFCSSIRDSRGCPGKYKRCDRVGERDPALRRGGALGASLDTLSALYGSPCRASLHTDMPRLPASLGSWTARARPHAVAAVAPSLVSSAFHSSANAPSHVGSAAIPVPSTVTIQLPSLAAVAPGATPAQAIVKGPKGQLAVELASFVRLTQQQQQQQGTEGQAPILDHFVVDIENPAVKHQRAVWGLTRALLANAVVGVSEGYTLPIRLVGVGYRATVEDIPPSSRTNHSGPQPTQRLNLKLGFAHPVLIDLPPDVTATTPAPNAIALSGIDKQRLGQVAAQIRAWRVPEPYNASRSRSLDPLRPQLGRRLTPRLLFLTHRVKGSLSETSKYEGKRSRRSST